MINFIFLVFLLKSKIVKSIGVASGDRKPNLIFDKTLKDIEDFYHVVRVCNDMGYEAKDIHLIWIATPTKEAIKNNKSRGRSVPEEIVKHTHSKVSKVMKDVISSGDSFEGFVGDIWIIPNSRERKDTVLKYDDTTNKSLRGGNFVEKDRKIKVKSAGNVIKYDYEKLVDELVS